ncbi:MAG: glycosyltransferase family 2 protein [Planctomycetaceae bacterium]
MEASNNELANDEWLPGEPQLSIVVPAFNEASRISTAIDDIVANIPVGVGTSWELIVVDDGSQDRTAEVVCEISDAVPSLRLLHHSTNQGKGAAVRTGVLAAKGRFVVFADADGATPFSEADKLLQAVREGAGLAVGTRISGAGVQRSLLRSVMAAAFRLSVRSLTSVRERDTQCGFKMFERQTARILFQRSRETGYLFDLEILGLASRLGLVIREVPVMWREVAGSRVRLVQDSWNMLVGLFRVRHTLRGVAGRLRDSESSGNVSTILRVPPTAGDVPATTLRSGA